MSTYLQELIRLASKAETEMEVRYKAYADRLAAYKLTAINDTLGTNKVYGVYKLLRDGVANLQRDVLCDTEVCQNIKAQLDVHRGDYKPISIQVNSIRIVCYRPSVADFLFGISRTGGCRMTSLDTEQYVHISTKLIDWDLFFYQNKDLVENILNDYVDSIFD